MGCSFATPTQLASTAAPAMDKKQTVETSDSVHLRARTATEDAAIEMKANLTLCFDSKDFVHKYKEGAVLGEGITGTVSIVISRDTGETYAMKTLNKHCVAAAQLSELRNEIEVLKTLDHPNVIRLLETFEDKTSIRLIMERCTGGELAARHFSSEAEIAAVLTQIVQAIAHCHYMGVVHRDLKLENIVFVTQEKSSPIKVIDFGLSRLQEGNSRILKSLCGTAYYMAPEMIDGQYTEKSDVWAIGVIAYMLLSGRAPFPGSTEKSVFKRIKQGRISFDGPEWANVSSFAISFCSSLLVVDPYTRPSASQALLHPWLARYIEDQKLHAEKISPDVAESLCRFAKYNSIRKCALMVIAHHLSHNELKELREVFLAADVDNSGTLTFEQISKLLERFGHEDLDESNLKSIFSGLHVDHLVHHNEHASGAHLARVHYMEFLAATVETRCVIDATALKVAFDHMDVDHTGYITAHSLKTVLGKGFSDAEVEEMVGRIDRDGRISKDEFITLMQGGQERFRSETVPTMSTMGSEANLLMQDTNLLIGRITEEPSSVEDNSESAMMSPRSAEKGKLTPGEPHTDDDMANGAVGVRRISHGSEGHDSPPSGMDVSREPTPGLEVLGAPSGKLLN